MLTSHIMSTENPLNFSSTCLYLGYLVCSCGPVTLKVSMLRPLYESITIVVNISSKDSVCGEMISPYFIYLFWLLALAYHLPFTIPYRFTVIKFTTSNDCLLSWFNISGSVGITTGFIGTEPSSICLSYLIIVSIVTSPKCLMSYFVFIWVNITSMAVFKYVAYFLPVLLAFVRNWLSFMDGYYSLSNLISILSITATVPDLLGLEFITDGAYVCSGDSISCGYLSASSVYSSSFDFSVSYSLYCLLVSFGSWSTLLSSYWTVSHSSSYSNCGLLRRFSASMCCLFSCSSLSSSKYPIPIPSPQLKIVWLYIISGCTYCSNYWLQLQL